MVKWTREFMNKIKSKKELEKINRAIYKWFYNKNKELLNKHLPNVINKK